MSGTTAGGLLRARSSSSPAGAWRRFPTADRGRAATLAGLFDCSRRAGAPGRRCRQPRDPPLWGARARRRAAARLPARRRATTARRRTGTSGTSSAWSARLRGPRGSLYVRRRHLPLARRRAACTCSRRSAWRRRSSGRDMPAGGVIVVASREDAAARARGRRRAGAARGALGQRHRHRRAARGERRSDLVALVCCDLGAIVRGRSLLRDGARRAARTRASAGCRPTRRSRRSARSPSPTRSARPATCACCPTPTRTCASRATPPRARWSSCSATSSRPTGGRGSAARGASCARRSRELDDELGVRVLASFEHEFQLHARRAAGAAVLAGGAARAPSRSPREVMGALVEAGARARALPRGVRRAPVRDPRRSRRGARGGRPRASCFKEVVREVARRAGHARELRAAARPRGGRATACTSTSACSTPTGAPLLYDAARPASLSELGARFAAGILRHARALSALTAPSPVSAARLAPHRWSAGAVCLARQNREALLRIPPLVALGGGDPAPQLRLEYRGADATANPYLALGAIVRAGLDGRARRAAGAADPRPRPGALDAAEAERFGVGALPASLEDALAALADDETARGWMPPLLYDAYVGVKRAELQTVARAGPRRGVPALCRDLLTVALLRAAAAPAIERELAARASSCATGCTPQPELAHAEERDGALVARGAAGRRRDGRRHRADRARRAARRARPSRCARSSTGCRCASARGAPFSATRRDDARVRPRRPHGRAGRARARGARVSASELPAPLLAVFQPSEEAYPSGAEQLAAGRARARSRRRRCSRRTCIPSCRGARSRSTPARSTPRATRSRSRRGRALARRLPAPRARPDPRARAGRRRAARAGRRGGSTRSRRRR